jgi:hypothetical protein
MNWKGVGLLKNPPVLGIAQRFSYKKPDNTYRKLIDLRSVNKICEPMYLSLPNMEDCMNLIGQENPRLFSLVDQKQGFWSLKVHPNSRKYLAFSTARHHYTYCRLPMGLSSFTYRLLSSLIETSALRIGVKGYIIS